MQLTQALSFGANVGVEVPERHQDGGCSGSSSTATTSASSACISGFMTRTTYGHHEWLAYGCEGQNLGKEQNDGMTNSQERDRNLLGPLQP